MTFLLAQCIMCARTAAAQNIERGLVLNKGILILLVPPVIAFAAICAMAWRRKADTLPTRDPQKSRFT